LSLYTESGRGENRKKVSYGKEQVKKQRQNKIINKENRYVDFTHSLFINKFSFIQNNICISNSLFYFLLLNVFKKKKTSLEFTVLPNYT